MQLSVRTTYTYLHTYVIVRYIVDRFADLTLTCVNYTNLTVCTMTMPT